MRFGSCQRGGQFGQQVRARQQRQAGLLRQRAGRVFESELPHLPGRRPDEGNAGGFAGGGECGVLGQEAIARVDGLGAALARNVEDALLA